MNESKLNFGEALVLPVLGLLCTSALGVLLVGLRIAWSHHLHFVWLIWNLFLAWLPLLFAVGVCRQYQNGARHGWRLYLPAGLWLLFLPNAPYIFTDLIHLHNRFRGNFWLDLGMILVFALTGILLGFISLYLMQSVVADWFGMAASWLFILVATGLCGFGVYLGRFKRWNSWDAIVHPLGVSRSIGHSAAHPLANSRSLAFSALFAIFLFLGYLTLYALTHLPPSRSNERFAE